MQSLKVVRSSLTICHFLLVATLQVVAAWCEVTYHISHAKLCLELISIHSSLSVLINLKASFTPLHIYFFNSQSLHPSPLWTRACLRSTPCQMTPVPLFPQGSSESCLPMASRSAWSESTSSRLMDSSPKTPMGRYKGRKGEKCRRGWLENITRIRYSWLGYSLRSRKRFVPRRV